MTQQVGTTYKWSCPLLYTKKDPTLNPSKKLPELLLRPSQSCCQLFSYPCHLQSSQHLQNKPKATIDVQKEDKLFITLSWKSHSSATSQYLKMGQKIVVALWLVTQESFKPKSQLTMIPITLPETSIASENKKNWNTVLVSFWDSAYVQVLLLLVLGSVSNWKESNYYNKETDLGNGEPATCMSGCILSGWFTALPAAFIAVPSGR